MNKSYIKKISLYGILIIMAIIFYPTNIFASGGVSSGFGKKIKCGGTFSCTLSNIVDVKYEVTESGDNTTVTINASAGIGTESNWVAYAEAVSNKDVLDFFDSSGNLSATLNNDTWKKMSSSDGLSLSIDEAKHTDYIQVFIQPASCFEFTYEGDKGKEKTKKLCPGTLRVDKDNDNNLSISEVSGNTTFAYESHKELNTKYSFKIAQTSGKTSNKNKIFNKLQCKAMREGQYYIDGSKKNKDVTEELKAYKNGTKTFESLSNAAKYQYYAQTKILDSNNKPIFQEKMKRYYPYCYYEQGANINFSNKHIKKARHFMMNYFYKVYSFSETAKEKAGDNNNYTNNLNSYKKNISENPTQLDSSGKANINDLFCGKDSKKPESKAYWTGKETLNNKACTVSCIEKMVTTYSPPIFTKGGMCFTYKVTVKSKVDCKMDSKIDVNDDAIWPENKYSPPDVNSSECGVRADCTGSSTTQAGPNDEYEICINECDGGKFTKKCSNKCYDQIYNIKKVTNKTKSDMKSIKSLSYMNKIDASVKFLANGAEEEDTCTNENDVSEDCMNEKEVSKGDPYKYYWVAKGDFPSYAVECSKKSKSAKCIDLDKTCGKWEIFSIDNTHFNKNGKDVCIKGFMHAKSEKPLGDYKPTSSGSAYVWKKVDELGDCKDADTKKWSSSESAGNRTETTVGCRSIVSSMKRAASYYLSNENETGNSISALFGYDYHHTAGRVYDFDNNGIKRQHNNTYTCHDQCYFYLKDTCGIIPEGSPKFNKADKNEIMEDIEKCKKEADNSCSTDEETFYISAEDNAKSNNCSSSNISQTLWNDGHHDTSKICSYKGTLRGTNTSGETYKNYWKNDTDMFVRLYKDVNDKINGIDVINEGLKDLNKYPDGQDNDNSNDSENHGINGSCFGVGVFNVNESYDAYHQYKTTITFPGLYINLKSGEKTSKSVPGSTKAKEKYCTSFDTENVNEDWWIARNKGQSYSGSIKYNIRAQVKDFGKFHWSFSTRCFYGIYQDITGGCSKDDPNYPTCANIRVVDPQDVFNVKTNADNADKIGFNWTSTAKIPDTFDSKLKDGGYTIDPQQYLKSVETIAQGNTNIDVDSKDFTNSSGTYNDSYLDFHAKITPDNMSAIRAYSEKISKFDVDSSNSSSCSHGASGYFVPYGENGSDGNPKPVFSVYHSCILDRLGNSVVQKDNFSSVTNRKNGGDR